MTKSLKLLACLLYVTFATTACHPNVQTHDSPVSPKVDDKVTIIAASDLPDAPHELVEYKVVYDTNRVVRCLGLKSRTVNQNFERNSLTCDWERSTYEGKH